MIEATLFVLRYRLVLQNLWNNYCWLSEDLRNIETMHEFELLKIPLFNFFVLGSLSCVERVANVFGPAFSVLPPKGKDGKRIGPLKLSIGVGQTGKTWYEASYEMVDGEFECELIDFFDWRLYYFRDFRFFRVLIKRWDSQPDKVGSEALVDVLSVDVIFNPELVVRRG